jgi:two-component system response regulator PilR (NtrC family)
MLRSDVRANDFLVAESKAMRAVAEQVAEYADGDNPVLICGEHGTGRELVARVLHQRGPRGRGRFVAVRPSFEGSDVPHVAGDDACERARRALKAAAGGTLLVKDMSDLSGPSQKTLKRAIRDRKTAADGAVVQFLS